MTEHTKKPGDQGTADDALIDAYFDGTASEAEMAELEAHLQASPETTQHFLMQARLDRDLALVLRRDKHPLSPLPPSARRPRVLLLAGTGAGAAAALVALVLHTVPERADKAGPQSLTDSATSPISTSAGQATPATAMMPPPLAAEAPRVDETIGFQGQRVPVEGLAAAPPNMVKAASLFMFDFERESEGFPKWTSGTRKACPPGIGGRWCIAGDRFESHPEQVGVTLGDWRRTMFAFSGDLFITFDYWIGETTGRDPDIEVLLHRQDGRTFRMDLATHVRGRWAHVTLPFSAVRRWHKPDEAMHEGDPVTAVHITMPSRADDVFRVDNVEIARYARVR